MNPSKSNRLKFLVVALLLATVAPFAWLWTALPEPMATQWSLRGVPSSALPRIVAFAVFLILAAASCVHSLALLRGTARTEGSVALGGSVAMGSLVAVLAWLTVLANAGASSWREAAPMPLPVILASFAACVTAGVLVRRAARELDAARATPSAGLEPGERAVFVGNTRAPAWGWTALVALSSLPLAWLHGGPQTALSLLVVAAVCAPFSTLRVVADHRGVTLYYGPLGWPRQHVRLDDIEHAEVVTIHPMSHGGWGYRGLLTFGRAAVVVRRGEGLKLSLRGNRTFLITMDRPASAAGLINDYKRAASSSP